MYSTKSSLTHVVTRSNKMSGLVLNVVSHSSISLVVSLQSSLISLLYLWHMGVSIVIGQSMNHFSLLKLCVTRSHLGVTESPECYTESPGCYTQSPGCYTESPGCYTESPGCYTQSLGCYTQSPGCYTQSPSAQDVF